MKIALSALLVACSAAIAAAQNYVLTNPTEGSKLQAGKIAKIMWTPVKNPPIKAVTISIDLMNGDSNAASYVTGIVENLQPTATFFEWQVPANLAARADYFLKMYAIAEDTERSYSYSSRFSVLGGDGSFNGGGAAVDAGAAGAPGSAGAKKNSASSVAASGALAVVAGAGALLL